MMNRSFKCLGFAMVLGLLIACAAAQQPSDNNPESKKGVQEKVKADGNESSGGTAVPVMAPVQTTSIPILEGLPPIPGMLRPVFDLYFAISGKTFYPFPTPVLGEMQLAVDGKKVPLFKSDGAVGIPEATKQAVLTCLPPRPVGKFAVSGCVPQGSRNSGSFEKLPPDSPAR